MIPKIIHYCWFGKNPLPPLVEKCIASWKLYCPDYEIICWNEERYDIHQCEFTEQAYQAGKWAFVADYVRLDVLVKYGGIYLDTDVELLKPIDYLLDVIKKPRISLGQLSQDIDIPGAGIFEILPPVTPSLITFGKTRKWRYRLLL